MEKAGLFIVVLIIVSSTARAGTDGKHLFILSGQSNMARLDPNESFTPLVEKAFGKANVLIVKDAQSGQPIRRWYKDWTSASGERPKKNGELYDRLMAKVRAAASDIELKSVTFIWMQGERDAREKHGRVYEKSLTGLIEQLTNDMSHVAINVVIGRLSDFDVMNEKYPHWTLVREAQVRVASALPRAVWINTDDLNDGFNAKGEPIENDLHYSRKGYRIFGQRCAEASIKLFKQLNF